MISQTAARALPGGCGVLYLAGGWSSRLARIRNRLRASFGHISQRQNPRLGLDQADTPE